MLVTRLSEAEVILINDQYFIALIEDIDQARSTIDISTYIYNNDKIGQLLADRLAAAAKRGVKVRLLLDGVGALFLDQEILKMMEQHGVRIRIYHPLPWMAWQWGRAAHVPLPFLQMFFSLFTRLNSRNHRKMCMIDNCIIYVSSANIAQCHLGKDQGGEGWRDTTVRLEGINTDYLEFAFEKSWRRLSIPTKSKIRFPNNYVDPVFNLNFNWWQRRKLYRSILRNLSGARSRIWITSAYFLPDTFFQRALIKATQRQVDVRILLSKKSDVLISSLVATTFYTQLLKNNIQIYEYLPSMLHAKILIIDDWISVGTSNLNSRSLKHDLEIDVKLQSNQAKECIKAQFLADLKKSHKVELSDLKKQSALKKILGRLLLFMRYWM